MELSLGVNKKVSLIKKFTFAASMVTKFDKVVRREMCRVTTRGTQTFSFLDGDSSECQSSFLLGIAEKVSKIYSHSFLLKKLVGINYNTNCCIFVEC